MIRVPRKYFGRCWRNKEPCLVNNLKTKYMHCNFSNDMVMWWVINQYTVKSIESDHFQLVTKQEENKDEDITGALVG